MPATSAHHLTEPGAWPRPAAVYVAGMAPRCIRSLYSPTSWGWYPPETLARPVNPSNLIRIMPAKG